ncbi:sacsin N-terminal ATP-binding-like domain-containing protein [Kitasatospora sp. NPDC059646]|uniref:sacsin N-terminal ATP-binding-like domain-containing protein n=1 Tax=Kitasatospora sp. NPDC059646 TaxID=3346893 RepID=UPI00368721DA
MHGVEGRPDGRHARELRTYSETVLREWQGTPTWRPGQQLRAVSLMSSRDYAGRFLLELLQNGHDAHPADRTDGRVHVLLDEREGPHGTLYVANAGRLFGREQVERVCKLAQSDKRVGDGIGNKGLGFRSVLEITDSPEIYSDDRSDGPAGRLDGYRFRFATPDDLRTLLGDEALAAQAEREFPPLQLPFPIDELPPTCRELGEAGHVTAIRLELRGTIAREQAARRLKELAAARTPVMLFLGRLGRLVLEHRKADGTAERTELVRHEEPVTGRPPQPHPFLAPAVSTARVDLGGLGEFLVARGSLPDRRLRDTLDTAVGNGSLDATWLDWQEEAAVEVALPLGDGDRRGQYYTFLPLGEDVTAPLRGHVNAPFFTKMDRTALDREHPLNAMLLDALAETCLLAAESWRAAGGDRYRRAAVDVLGWDATARSADLLATAARRVHRRPFAEVPLVPVLDGGTADAWRSPGEAVLWPADELVTLTAEAAGAAGIPVADPAVGPGRLRRLARICAQLKCALEPGPGDRAAHVERIAATLPLPRPGESVEIWDGLYSDLAELFRLDYGALRGRRLLLTDDGTLGRCNGGAATAAGRGRAGARREAFFPPAAGADGGIAVPDVLRKRLFHLHPALACTAERGERALAARQFLRWHDLVRPFDPEQLLEHVKLALAESNSQRLRSQALRFVFRLHRAHPSTRHLVAGLGLHVPTAAGPTVLAGAAVFGAGWAGTHGDDLAAVVEEGRQVSADLRWTVDRLLAPPSEFVGRNETEEEWRAFLSAAGVRDGLLPVYSGGATDRANGNRLHATNLVRMAKVSPKISAQWAPHVTNGPHDAQYPQTPYVGTPAWRLPGQDVVADFSEPGRLAYARLVLHGLSHWDEQKFAARWTRDRSGNPDPQHVLTPLAAFVREQPWLPVRGHGRAGAFARPADAWHYRGAPEEEPGFLRTVARPLRGRLDAGTVLERLRRLGLPTWDRAEDSVRMLTELGRLVAAGELGAADRPVAQRANQRAWKALTGLPEAHRTPQALVRRMRGGSLLIETGRGMAAVPVDDLHGGGRRIYVTERTESLTVHLLRETEHSLLVVPGAAKEATRLLRHLDPEAALLVEEARFAVDVDDGTAALRQLGRPLVEQLPWLPLAVAALADHAGGGIRPADSTLTTLVAAVRAVRLHGYRTIALAFDGHPIDLPEHLAGVLPLPGRRPLVLAPAALADPLDRTGAGALADAAAQAVRQQPFAVRLRLAAHELRAAHADVTAPDDHALAAALHLTAGQLRETRQRLDGSIAGLLERCLPVLVHLLGEQRARELTDPPPADLRDLRTLLAAHETELPADAEKLLAAARTARDVDDLRAALGIDFAAFNRTLAGLAPQYRPTSRAEEHQEAVRRHVDLHRAGLVDRLRWAHLACFDRREPIPGWAELRSLSWLTAPDDWSLTVDRIDAAGLRAHLEAELTARLGRPAPGSGDRLPALEPLRARNGALARRCAAPIATLLKAAGRPVPPALAAADPAPEFLALLDGAGALDFRQLDETDLVPWLAALGQWPAGLPESLDPADHGLTQDDLDRARDSAAQARAERARRQRLITFDGAEFDVAAGDFTELVEALERMVAQHPGTVRGGRGFTVLQEPGARRRPGAAGPARPGRFVAADRGLSAAQREAIGFVGEWIAYRWLRENHQAATEDSWVSANRRNVFPGAPGDDTLGYDFSVGTGRHPLLFEVKATQGDGGDFELGPSEVKAAQRYAGSDRWRILAVTHVLDPAEVRIDVLPNPYGPSGRGRYREEGGALRFSYRT